MRKKKFKVTYKIKKSVAIYYSVEWKTTEGYHGFSLGFKTRKEAQDYIKKMKEEDKL